MEHNNKPAPEDKQPQAPARKGLSAENWIMLIGVISFVVFLWMFALFFLFSRQRGPVAWPSVIVEIAATRGFVLPPTWTPGPTPEFNPTAVGTPVYDGTFPTRIYTPRPTSLPGVPMPVPVVARRNEINVIDLARIMQGESPGDKEAAYYVGWVAKNRLLHAGYGDTIAIVSGGFFGYRANLQPSEEFLDIALRVMRAKQDPTQGCLYALSRTDITKLGIPPQRADVTKGEWFFFRTWPLSGR